MRKLRTVFTGIVLAFAGLTVPAAVLAPPASASACTITADASTPAVLHSGYGAASITTASFSPPAGSLLEVRVNALQAAVSSGVTVTVTDSLSGTYTAGPHISGTSAPNSAWFFQRYLSTAPGAMTVTIHQSGTQTGTLQAKVKVLDGAASSQAGAASGTFQGSGTAQNHAITTTAAGSVVDVAAGNGDSASSAMTPLASTTNEDVWRDTASGNDGALGKSAATVTPGSTTLGWTASASDPFIWAAQEILPAQTCGTQAPPTVTTTAATSAGQTTATVNGTVNPNGAAATCHFDWGQTTAYGNVTPDDTSPGSGSTAVPVSANLTGLTASTAYHDRLVCSNSGGTTNGADATFTTTAPSAAPVVTTNAASSITSTSATLNGTVNPEGQATTYQFDWGTSTAYGSSVPVPAGSAGSGTAAVNESYNLTGLTASTTYDYRIEATNATGTTLGANATFTTSAAGAADILTRTDLIKASEIGEWQTDGQPTVNATISSLTTAAGIKLIRFATGDCFQGTTCGSNNHAGTVSRTSFDTAIQGIKNSILGTSGVLWFKLLPTSHDYPNTTTATSFCPPWTGDATQNLAMYKDQVNEIHNAGYTGPLVIEMSNEMYFDCTSGTSGVWDVQSGTSLGGGSVGVSKRVGEHFAQNAPALKAYARGLGFSQVVVGDDFGVPGGIQWGQTDWHADASAPWGYRWGGTDGSCTSSCFQTRWVDEFNNAVHSAYVAAGSSNPDYIPDFEAVHAYVHSPDNYASAPYEASITGNAQNDDSVLYSYFRNWIKKSRAEVENIWGTANGDPVRFAISEGSPGSSNSSGTWGGWTTAGRPGQFITGWFDMLKGTDYGGNGNLTGPGSSRYWEWTYFCDACNSDTSTAKYYDLIHQDGTTPSWYTDYKNVTIP